MGAWINGIVCVRCLLERKPCFSGKTGSLSHGFTRSSFLSSNPISPASITWKENGDRHRIEQRNGNTRRWINDSLVTEPEVIAAAERMVVAGRYTAIQPFNLLDDAAELRYEGRDTLENEKVVEVISARYREGSRDDWWYYFDIRSGRCVGTLVHHPPSWAYVQNVTYDTSTPFVFHHYRRTYRTDSLRNKQFTRAVYYYGDYEVELEGE